MWLKGRSDKDGTQGVRNVFHAFGLGSIEYAQRNQSTFFRATEDLLVWEGGGLEGEGVMGHSPMLRDAFDFWTFQDLFRSFFFRSLVCFHSQLFQ